MKYALEIFTYGKEWAGGLCDNWQPLIAGTLNQTGQSNEWASSTDTLDAAMVLLDEECVTDALDEYEHAFRVCVRMPDGSREIVEEREAWP